MRPKGPVAGARADGDRHRLLRRYGYQELRSIALPVPPGYQRRALLSLPHKEELLFESSRSDRRVESGSLAGSALRPIRGALAEIARVCVHIAIKNNLRRFILTLMVEALDTNPKLSEAFRGILRRFRSYLAGISASVRSKGSSGATSMRR